MYLRICGNKLWTPFAFHGRHPCMLPQRSECSCRKYLTSIISLTLFVDSERPAPERCESVANIIKQEQCQQIMCNVLVSFFVDTICKSLHRRNNSCHRNERWGRYQCRKLTTPIVVDDSASHPSTIVRKMRLRVKKIERCRKIKIFRRCSTVMGPHAFAPCTKPCKSIESP